MNAYNGYSARQRHRISAPLKRKLSGEARHGADHRCSICDDPDRPAHSWHSEDYSEPFLLGPPATFAICKPCHKRLHERFNQPDEWPLFLEHLRRGGHGREFAKWYSRPQRRAWIETIREGGRVALPRGRPRNLTGSEWWQGLTLDPESLVAAWARPRPLRPRPSTEDFAQALADLRPTPVQMAILRFHAAQPWRAATMRHIARGVLSCDRPKDANLAYGTLAHRICDRTSFRPDLRDNGTKIWMSTVAEGWQPDGREFEWVMVPTLAQVVDR